MSHRHVTPLRMSFLVAAMTWIAPFSLSTYLPSFPDIQASLGASELDMQHSLSYYLWAFAAMTLVYGPLSDAHGRRSVVLWAFCAYAIASIVCALAGSIEVFLLGRAGQGMAAAAGLVIGRAALRDVFGGAQARRVMSTVMLIFAGGPAVAPIIGGVLQDWFGWRPVFWFLAAFGIVVWLIVFLRLPETLPPVARVRVPLSRVGHVYRDALTRGRFLALVVMTGFNFGGMFLYIAASPFVLYRHLGFEATEFWRLFVPLMCGIVLGAWSSGRFAERIEPRQAVRIGYGVMAFGVALNLMQAWWLEPTSFNVIAPVAVYAAGMSFAVPNLSLMALDCFPCQRGMASAVMSAFQLGSNGVIAGFIVAWAAQALPRLALVDAMLFATSLMLWLWFARRGDRGHATASP
ncbi:MAG: multidrug effflux MFS transporter [Ectothiorhodospiraceae bacterium]|nr:multidrug effflux MFS transporter [Ectothiorhodospiraceae bacterium]